ncbi:HNH endonuclease [Halobacterium salinarum]|uniref:HNH endonuclease n=1 Tax=Halobacterium salinarum TaxID=2242 RepID=UPI0030CA2613
MSIESEGKDYPPSYIAGLLDATGRVRFNLSKAGDGEYTVRPSLRVYSSGSQYRKAGIGISLDTIGCDYEFVCRENAKNYFSIIKRSQLDIIRQYLSGQSTHLIRELEFVATVFEEEFDGRILSVEETYRFLRTRNKLRYDFKLQAPKLIRAKDIKEEYEIDSSSITLPSLPEAPLGQQYSMDYIAGLFDGCCVYRPSIAKSEEHAIGFSMQPTLRLYRSGVSKQLVNHFQQFCEDYDLRVANSSEDHNLHVSFTGASAIRRVLEVIIQKLIVAREYSVDLRDEVLPKFDDGDHLERAGFIETLYRSEDIAISSDGSYKPNEYSSGYFTDIWEDEVSINKIKDNIDENRASKEGSVKEVENLDGVSVSPDRYSEEVGRYQTVVSRQNRNQKLVEELKQMYSNRCQLCGDRRARQDGTGYSEVHHVKPLGQPHDGLDKRKNMIVVCPNHHADFDNGVLTVDPETKEISHPYDRTVDECTLATNETHEIDDLYLEYHNNQIATSFETN